MLRLQFAWPLGRSRSWPLTWWPRSWKILENPGIFFLSWKILECPGIVLNFEKCLGFVLENETYCIFSPFTCTSKIIVWDCVWIIYTSIAYKQVFQYKLVLEIPGNLVFIAICPGIILEIAIVLSWKNKKIVLENPGKSWNLDLKFVWSPCLN